MAQKDLRVPAAPTVLASESFVDCVLDVNGKFAFVRSKGFFEQLFKFLPRGGAVGKEPPGAFDIHSTKHHHALIDLKDARFLPLSISCRGEPSALSPKTLRRR